MEKLKTIGLVIISAILLACIENSAPVADAGPDITVSPDSSPTVALSALASYDPNGDIITYHWTIEEKPSGSEASLSSFTDAIVEITLDVQGVYKISLVVDDGKTSSPKDRLTIVYGVPGIANQAASESADHFGVSIEGKACEACHQLIDAEGLIIPHVQIKDDCDACHGTMAWRPVVTVNHSAVLGSCESCHDSQVAAGKSINHIQSTDECKLCHITVTWSPTLNINHQAVLGECIDCHNGYIASGKSANHIASDDNCALCHSTDSWIGSRTDTQAARDESAIVNAGAGGGGSGNADNFKVQFNHTGIIDNCSFCHNGQVARGFSSSHINSSDQCEACHSTTTFIPVRLVDHSQLTGACFTCHNNVIARGKSITHIASTNLCDACHSVLKMLPVNTVDHSQVLGTCEMCHAPPSNHIATGVTASCHDCHNTQTWSQATSPLPALIPIDGGIPRI